MASKNPGRREMKALIDQFCAVSGGDRDAAKQLLEACAWNLDMAIGMHLDGGGAQNTPSPSGSQSSQDAEENVRAPIPQRQEVLVDSIAYPTTIRRRTARSVFDGFRDFQAEARQQERQQSTNSGASSSTGGGSKLRTLEDLFRPPIDIMHKGSFHSARDAGSSRNRWLIVNIQNSKEFTCQILNRDVWSHRTVKDIVKEQFIFWQVYHDSEEGRKYMQFYKITDWPYVAVIDPRTGENLVVWKNIDQVTFCDLVTAFLAEKPSPDGSSPSAAKPQEKEKTLADASEDSQLELAIKASLQQPKNSTDDRESTISDSDEESEELETFSDSGSDTLTGPPKSFKNSLKKMSAGPSTSSTSSSESQSKGVKRKADDLVDDLDKPKASKLEKQKGIAKKCKSLKVSSNNGVPPGVSPHDLSNDNSNDNSNDSIKSKSVSSGATDNEQSPKVAQKEEKCSEEKAKTDDSSSEYLNWQHYAGPDSDPKSKLALRFPDGQKEQFSLPCTSKLRALILYVAEKGYSNESYELVTNYPRRKISQLDADTTLKDNGLFPQEAIFIQAR